MKLKNIVLISLIISVLITVIGMVIYDKFMNKPMIIFERNMIPQEIVLRNVESNIEIPSFKSAVAKNINSIVYIRVIRKDDEGGLSFDVGSGCTILPTGEIVTNEHVIHDAEKIIVTDYKNNEYTAKLVGADIGFDIAVIKVEGENMPFVFFGNSDIISVGEWIAAIGNPFKLRNSVTVGVVSSLHRSLQKTGRTLDSYIQTDAMANPGNSGGVLLNQDGKMIGMVTSKLSDDENFQGFSFALPSNIVRKSAFDIINFGAIQKAYAGLAVIDNGGTGGALVEGINKNGAAYEAGIMKGDVIKYFGGIKLDGATHLMEKIAQFNPGDSVIIQIERDDKNLDKILVLRNNLNTKDLIVNRRDKILTDYGLILREHTKKELKSGDKGVYVISVINGSISGKVGIKPGFHIVKANGISVNSVDQFIEILKLAQDQVFLLGYYKIYPGEFKYVLKKH